MQKKYFHTKTTIFFTVITLSGQTNLKMLKFYFKAYSSCSNNYLYYHQIIQQSNTIDTTHLITKIFLHSELEKIFMHFQYQAAKLMKL
jgi:hypothetical protein